MYYETFGKGAPVVVLHGWGASGKLARPLARLMGEGRFIIPDFYGFGSSPHPDHALRLDDYVDGVREILGKEGVSRATIIGHSFGGRVAIKLAVNYPELAERLILVNSAGIKPRRGLRYLVRVARYKLAKKMGKNLDHYGSSDYRALSSQMKGTFVNVVNEDLTPILKRITCPTLVIAGESDRDVPLYMGKIMKNKIKNSKLAVIQGAGHFSYVDSPNGVRCAVSSWLEGDICR